MVAVSAVQAISEAMSLRLAIPRLTSDLRLANNNDDLATGSKDVAQGSQTEEARTNGD